MVKEKRQKHKLERLSKLSGKKGAKPLTRHQFEKLIKGTWIKEGRRRQNGKFFTWVFNNQKFVTDGKSTLRAGSWSEIAKALRLT